jgi:uridine kinase
MQRKELIKIIVNEIEKLQFEHPIRVGVSGITASGKSTLAQEIALEIVSRGYLCIKASIDDFHNPKKLRYSQALSLAHAYYENAHDYDALRERLLKPLGKGGNLTYQTQSLDLETDISVDPEPQVAAINTILVVDGTFLFKEKLNDYWDFRIFVHTDFEIALKRGIKRDQARLGGESATEKRYLERYHKASMIYINDCNPMSKAQLIVNNNNFNAPDLTLSKI